MPNAWKYYAGLNVLADIGLLGALWLVKVTTSEIPSDPVSPVSFAYSFGKLFSFF